MIAKTALREPPNETEEPLHVETRETAGGLVQDEHPGVAEKCPGDLDDLLLRDGKRPQAGVRGNVPVLERGERLSSPLPHLRAPEDSEAARLHSEEKVLRNRKVGRERELLMDHGNPGLARGAGARGTVGLSAEEDLPLVGREDSREELHQRRLAGAVLSHESADFPRSHPEVDSGDGERRAESFDQAPGLEDLRHYFSHRSMSGRRSSAFLGSFMLSRVTSVTPVSMRAGTSSPRRWETMVLTPR